MGYYSNFKLQIIPPSEDVEQDVKETSGYAWSGNELHDAKWYDSDDDCTEVSKRHPHHVIFLEVVGEDGERTAVWHFNGQKAYGKYELVPPHQVEVWKVNVELIARDKKERERLEKVAREVALMKELMEKYPNEIR